MDIDTALPGAYDFPAPSHPTSNHTTGATTLHDGPVESADADGTVTKTTGRIFLDVRDELTVRWELDDFHGWGSTSFKLHRPDIGEVTIPAQVTRSNGHGYLDPVEFPPAGADELAHITAHWFNLPAILPADPLQAGSLTYGGRWVFEACGWRMTLDQRHDHKQAVEAARDTGHAAMTHTSRLEKVGHTFTSKEGQDVLLALEMALSFALGRWVAAALPVGFDRSSRRVWEQWANPRCSRFENGFRWWNTVRSDDLHEMCSSFLEHWLDPDRQAVIRHSAMHAICASSDQTTTEAKVMLAQAGIEYLGWVTRVLEGNVSAREYKKASAAANLTSLLKDAHIPDGIPADFTGLADIATSLAKSDPTTPPTAPYAIAWLRNRLVHPKDATEPYKAEGAIWNAWLLTVEYLDLLILRRLGYAGEHVPRRPNVWSTASQPVPWSRHP